MFQKNPFVVSKLWSCVNVFFFFSATEQILSTYQHQILTPPFLEIWLYYQKGHHMKLLPVFHWFSLISFLLQNLLLLQPLRRSQLSFFLESITADNKKRVFSQKAIDRNYSRTASMILTLNRCMPSEKESRGTRIKCSSVH